MKKSFVLFGRRSEESEQLLTLCTRHDGMWSSLAPAGIGKTALLQHVRAILSVVDVCEDNSSLRPDLRQPGTAAWMGPLQAEPYRTQEPLAWLIWSADGEPVAV